MSRVFSGFLGSRVLDLCPGTPRSPPRLYLLKAFSRVIAWPSCGPFSFSYDQYERSSVRYWIASLKCYGAISSAPSRSAIVRATFRIRS
jgi:hypothetical protein